MADDSRFWRYFHDKLAWAQIFAPGPLSALVKGLALSLDQTRDDMIFLREQFSPETADKSLIEGFGASRGIIRNRLDTDETYRKRVINAFVWHKLGGKVAGVQQILAENGFLNAKIVSVNDVRRHDGSLSHNGMYTYGAGLCWASFNILLDIPESGLNQDVLTWLRWLVNEYKPARSKLRALSWALPLEDAADCTDTQFASVVTHPVDTRPWGFPLHDGTIRYNNGIHRLHDGKLRHDGKATYTSWLASGHRHDAQLDAVTLAMSASAEDTIRYAPHHNGKLHYDGQGGRGLLNAPAVDDSDVAVAVKTVESMHVTDTAALTASPRLRDNIGLLHDGSITHGQRRINIRNGLCAYNGTALRGAYGGMDCRAVRHDGLADHSGQALHSLWGWQPDSPHAPIFTYRSLADQCAVSLAATLGDSFALNDSFAAGVFRYMLHNEKYAHDGAGRYSAKEVV